MSTNCCGAEKVFDKKAASKEFRKYHKSGPGKPTKRLIEVLGTDFQNRTLLDIGGGIGAIQWHFLKNGGIKSTDVDYSGAYIEQAKSFAQSNGWLEVTEFHQGDFLELADQVTSHDVVTLDKVVCCYPDYELLLTNALDKCNKTIGLVYPYDGAIANFVAFMGRIFLALTGNSFRPYIHPVNKVRQHIVNQGFQRSHASTSFPWHVEVYHRQKQLALIPQK